MDPIAILVDNLTDGLRQITTYVTLGLVAAVSAFALEFRPSDPAPVSGPLVPIPMAPDAAKTLALGICFVAGVMASVTTDGAVHIADKLGAGAPNLLAAACSYSSVATAPIGIGLGAALLPLLLATGVMWRIRTRLRKLDPKEHGLIPLLVFLVPYGALSIALIHLPCRGLEVVLP
jgi:hypothetical protein